MAVTFNPFTGNLDFIDTTAAAGSNTEIQYNDSGKLAGSADLTWDDSGKELGVGGDINLDDGGTYTTTVQVVTPTANRTISFPDATGTVGLVAGSNGQLAYNNAGAYAGLSTVTTDGTDVTLTGRFISSLNGAASAPPGTFTGTWFTGGTSTTTKPQVLIEPTGATSTAWSTSGTGLGVNAASGFSGRLLDLQTNGTSRMAVQGDGKLGIGATTLYHQFTVGGSSAFPVAKISKTDSSPYNSGILALGDGNSAAVNVGIWRGDANSVSSGGNYLNLGGYNGIAFATGNAVLGSQNLAATIDNSGRLLVGTSSVISINTQNPQIQLVGNTSETSRASFINTASNNSGPGLLLGKSRGGAIVQDNDQIGAIIFNGHDGTAYAVQAARIQAEIDGAPGPNDMPGRLVFSTTADASANPTERLRITSAGVLQIANGGDIAVGTTTGTKIGTATTQKLGFYDATPVVQPTAVADITTTATAGSLPTPDGSVTIADATTPTVTELLEYCVELEAKLEAALGHLRTLGLIAT